MTAYRVCASVVLALGGLAAASGRPDAVARQAMPDAGVFAKDNLVAWCIVPFDAAKRGPKERAEMLKKLGIRRFAYDWREEHVPSFEEEILQLKRCGVEFHAFWSFRPEIVPLLRKHGLRPEFWITTPSPNAPTQDAKVEAAAKQLLPLVETTRQLGSKLGLYNHGGWGGEPENLLAVAKWLRRNAQADHVGIVYNFHHGHGHIADFAESLAAMKPYLLCINLNGMNQNADPKILPIGSGQHEQAMMEAIRQSGYAGPIGILGHRADVDAEVSLRQNLEGMKQVLKRMGDERSLQTYERC